VEGLKNDSVMPDIPEGTPRTDEQIVQDNTLKERIVQGEEKWNSSEVKMMVGIPFVGTGMCVQAIKSLIDLIGSSKYATKVSFIGNTYIHAGRNKIVEAAIELNATHLFFLDSDMSLKPGTLERLLYSNVDIIGANYHGRVLPLVSTVRVWDDNGGFLIAKIPEGYDKVFPCAAVATGCMLIKMEVFNIIEKPWFFYEQYEGNNFLGEDLYFCKKAHQKGIKVWCDAGLDVKHVGMYEY
jgi:hypothetical protein